MRCLFASQRRSALKADVTIIGAGVIGSAIAMELGRKGVKTLNIDKLAGPGQGSTSYSSGICRMYYSTLDSVKLSWEGYHIHQNWADHVRVGDDRGFPQFRETGSVILKSELSQPFLSRVIPHYDTLSIPYEHWLQQECASRLGWSLTAYGPPRRIDDELFGSVSTTNHIDGAVYFPRTGYVSDPQLATYNLYLAAKQTQNCEFLFKRNVTQIIQSAGKVSGVRLDDGTVVESGVVVNAAGPYSSLINKLAFQNNNIENDMNVTTRPMRTEVAYVPAPDVKMLPLSSDFDVGVYFRPEVGGKLLIGTQEPECDTHEYLEDPDKCSYAFTDLWTNLVYRAALRIPQIQIPNTAQGIVAMYDVTEDWMPVYDKSALNGYYLAIGTSGNQFKNAGVVGQIMSELILSCENGVDQDEMPLQLKLTHTGQILNTGTFSRKRTVNLDSSMSVLA